MFHVVLFPNVTVVSLALSVRIAPVSSEWSAVAVTAAAAARLGAVLSRTPFPPIAVVSTRARELAAPLWTAKTSADELTDAPAAREDVGHARRRLEERPETSDAQGFDVAAVEAD